MSALPVSVTAAYEPNVPQTPFVRGAEARSTTPRAASMPEPVSVPAPIVSGTESVGNQGPPVSAIVCPVGGVESALNVIAPVPVSPVPLVAVSCLAPGARAEAVHVYATGDENGAVVSVPPVDPLHPVVAETSGKATWAMPDSPSVGSRSG